MMGRSAYAGSYCVPQVLPALEAIAEGRGVPTIVRIGTCGSSFGGGAVQTTRAGAWGCRRVQATTVSRLARAFAWRGASGKLLSSLVAMENIDAATVQGFGHEWSRFDQGGLSDPESRAIFEQYFHVFPWSSLPANAVGFDLGCGSGRWAKLMAPRVGSLHCIDASAEALGVAKRNLSGFPNAVLHHASVAEIPLEDGSMDFGYSLGVLHHVPNTAAGIASCVAKLKRGAPFLVYLYYAFDNRPAWFRALWRASDMGRRVISRMPYGIRALTAEAIAVGLYYPLARGAAVLEKAGVDVGALPLSAYRHRSFYVMRTDALDRFGTRLEQRFTEAEVRRMMEAAGLRGVVVSDRIPFWCAVGTKS
jgi:SAM-dependent methyltransferase